MLDELPDVLEDEPVIGPVEIVLAEQVGDLVPRGVVEEQPAQHGLLGLERLRRDPRRLDLAVLGDRGDELGLGHVAVSGDNE